MDIRILPGKLSGQVDVIPSKSQAHRLFLCAAFSKKSINLICPEISEDIAATIDCLRALGSQITKTSRGYRIDPIETLPDTAVLDCRESGSTLRFLLPVVGALGIETVFHMSGRLPSRPITPLWEEMERMGCRLSRLTENAILCRGKLTPGEYRIAGNVSSQFISGLLFAHALMDAPATLEITGTTESSPYIEMTRSVLRLFSSEDGMPDTIAVEGDWSNGAFWLVANALGSKLDIRGLCPDSLQGDRTITHWIDALHRNCTIPAENIPDLVPVLSVLAAATHGTVFTGIRRLRLKESDRVASILAMIRSLGGNAEATGNTLIIHGTGLVGGTVESFRDHRIAMAAAIASTVCSAPVTVLDAECVQKSYPRFWEEFQHSGGIYEQHIR